MKAKRIVTVIVSVLLWVVILISALFAFTTLATRDTQNVQSFFGFTPLTVQSESMAPFFKEGDLIFIKKCDTSKLKVGDVITFHTIIMNQYELNTHRIVELDESNGLRTYTTKGDNNEFADTHIITDGDIVGKYSGKIPGFGNVMDFLSSSAGFLIVIVLPMLAFFIYQVYHLVIVSISLKKAMAAEEAAASSSSAMSDAQKALEEANRLKAEYEAMLAKAKAESGETAAPAEAPKSEGEGPKPE